MFVVPDVDLVVVDDGHAVAGERELAYYSQIWWMAGWPWAVARPGLPQIRTWTH